MIHLTHEALALVGVLSLYLVGCFYIIRGYLSYDLGDPSSRQLHSIITAQLAAIHGSEYLCNETLNEIANLYVLHSLFRPSGKPGMFVLRDGGLEDMTLRHTPDDKYFEYRLYVNGVVRTMCPHRCYGMLVCDIIKEIAVSRTPRNGVIDHIPHLRVDIAPAISEISRLAQNALMEHPLAWLPSMPPMVGFRRGCLMAFSAVTQIRNLTPQQRVFQ